MFHDEHDARAVARRLAADGFEADLRREGLAGEDDDEDRAWVLTSDCPGPMLEMLVEEHGGLAEDDETTGRYVQAPPMELPVQPRRHHRP